LGQRCLGLQRSLVQNRSSTPKLPDAVQAFASRSPDAFSEGQQKKSQVRFFDPRRVFPGARGGTVALVAGRETATRRSGFVPGVRGRWFGAGSLPSSSAEHGG
jgi:hypothetical protein